MSAIYRYGQRKIKHHHVVIATVFVVLAIIGTVGFFIYKDASNNGSGSTEGSARIVGQVVNNDKTDITIDDPLYTMQLPSDWKEQSRTNSTTEKSVTWRATLKGKDSRTLTIYVDTIPATKSINRLLPITVEGGGMQTGDVSDNCISFSGPAATDRRPETMKETPAKWAGVDFICNVPGFVDNQVGAASKDGVNTVVLTGPKGGTHKYFFLYTDHDIQPDYSIFVNALQSFKAK